MAQDIDRKLRLTAAVLGTVTRKDLAAAFRRVNPATAFDVDRANKWLQGRAQPRQLSVYEDWSKLLKLDRPGAWIATAMWKRSPTPSANATASIASSWSAAPKARAVARRPQPETDTDWI